MGDSAGNIIIVGGGSAGWLTAGVLASQLCGDPASPVTVTLVESPDVKTIGVGEGTWPTMRATLQKIGLSEKDFLRCCTASFKQGTQFVNWTTGVGQDHYYHPFSAPAGYGDLNLAAYWQEQKDRVSFVDAVSIQGYLCDRNLAPKQAETPDYAFVANYGYHLDAGLFADMLQKHCTQHLGVRHILDHVTGVVGSPDEDIRAITLVEGGELTGDLFIDCTGLRSLLLGEHYQIPFNNRSDVLFNDSALAMQVPHADPNGPIASQTNSTAQSAGWVWDIGLQNRRGIGYTYSSQHVDDEQALLTLQQYVRDHCDGAGEGLEARKIKFTSGHRNKFWHRNCVAIGMSAGFLEPLEASALVMIELAAGFIADEYPAQRGTMGLVAERFNGLFLYRWDRIIDFLKLHYVLSQREDAEYWHDNRESKTIPDSLQARMELWQNRVPWLHDFPYQDEIFSAASYQYVLYGMGFATQVRKSTHYQNKMADAQQHFVRNNQAANQAVSGLPGNRELLKTICR